MTHSSTAESALPIVYIIDDDPLMLASLDLLLRSVGLRIRAFESTEDFHPEVIEDAPGCVLLDVRLRGESGLMFQHRERHALQMPIIFMSGHTDVHACVTAMKAGAVDFLTKPMAEQQVIDAVMGALSLDVKRREDARARETAMSTFNTLTTREREVLVRVVAGALNKRIAADLGISEVTVKIHRASVMRKMHTPSLPDLVRASQAIGIVPVKC
ncbi:response regulator transcription factor [Cupriavidus plantarum]|uniref:response regulator transcription factor n=1 Tax=Cupriavidus plantarum TaxID=942865 RepID=UPI001BA4DCCF|nr:response regulator [Cupriavidus plantarum]SMR85805.1 Two-component response regulator, FixJ family, consists of REC and HTH domains [Cupriavidus plantarum]